MRILLVSDDADLRVALQILLREEPSCDVIAAVSSSGAALSLLAASCPDLVVLDWDLRGSGAPKMLAYINALDSPPRVVAVGKQESDESSALKAGVTIFLVKGGPPEGLIRAILESGSGVTD